MNNYRMVIATTFYETVEVEAEDRDAAEHQYISENGHETPVFRHVISNDELAETLSSVSKLVMIEQVTP